MGQRARGARGRASSTGPGRTSRRTWASRPPSSSRLPEASGAPAGSSAPCTARALSVVVKDAASGGRVPEGLRGMETARPAPPRGVARDWRGREEAHPAPGGHAVPEVSRLLAATSRASRSEKGVGIAKIACGAATLLREGACTWLGAPRPATASRPVHPERDPAGQEGLRRVPRPSSRTAVASVEREHRAGRAHRKGQRHDARRRAVRRRSTAGLLGRRPPRLLLPGTFYSGGYGVAKDMVKAARPSAEGWRPGRPALVQQVFGPMYERAEGVGRDTHPEGDRAIPQRRTGGSAPDCRNLARTT